MTIRDKRYPDLVGDGDDPRLLRVVAGLDALGRAAAADSLSPEQDREIRRALTTHALEAHRRTSAGPRVAQSRGHLRSPRMRVASLVSAALIALAGLGAYTQHQAPTPASAAQILHRAALTMTPPAGDDLIRQVLAYDGSGANSSPLLHWTATQWVRFAADGSIDRLDSAIVVDGRVEHREVLNDKDYWGYMGAGFKAKGPVASVSPAAPLRPAHGFNGIVWPIELMTEPRDLGALRGLLMAAATKAAAITYETRLLPQRTVDGHRVDVVQVVHRWPDIVNGVSIPSSRDGATMETATFYIDAANSVLRGVDERDQDAQGATVATGRLRVVAYEVIPAADAPADTFTYTPPPGIQVWRCTSARPPACTIMRAAGSN